jgi:hypothetical protein
VGIVKHGPPTPARPSLSSESFAPLLEPDAQWLAHVAFQMLPPMELPNTLAILLLAGSWCRTSIHTTPMKPALERNEDQSDPGHASRMFLPWLAFGRLARSSADKQPIHLRSPSPRGAPTKQPEMNTITVTCRLLLSALCGIGLITASPAAVTYDFNANDGGFTSTLNTAAFDGPWVYGATSGAGGSGGWSTEGQNAEDNHPNTTDLNSQILGVSAAGAVTLSFDHRWAFEADATNWDGGGVFIAINGGVFTPVLGASFTANGYNGTVGAGNSQLTGQPAFVGTSAGHAAGTLLTTTANLGTFAAGDTLQVRFRAAYDTNTSGGSPDWVVDNILVSNVNAIPEPCAVLLGGLGLLGLLRRRRVGVQ